MTSACVEAQIDKTKTPILVKAADKLLAGGKFKGLLAEMQQFAKDNAWCEDSALFHALTHHKAETKDKAWWTWEGPLRYILYHLPSNCISQVALSCISGASAILCRLPAGIPAAADCRGSASSSVSLLLMQGHSVNMSVSHPADTGSLLGIGRMMRKQSRRPGRSLPPRSSALLPCSTCLTANGRLSRYAVQAYSTAQFIQRATTCSCYNF